MDFTLTAEQHAWRDRARDFAQDNDPPTGGGARPRGDIPGRARGGVGAARLPRPDAAARVGRHRRRHYRLLPRPRRISPCRRRDRDHRRSAHLARLRAARRLRHARAAGALPAAPRQRRATLGLRADRGGGRDRRRRHRHRRDPRRAGQDDRWRETLHRQWRHAAYRRGDRAGAHRPPAPMASRS